MILFGYKGVGKTYFGKKLAAEMQLPFIDTDDLLPASPKELYHRLGNSAFRALEKQVIFSLQPAPIIAVGGGAVLDPENVAYLQTLGALVYLKASLQFLQQRALDHRFLSPERLPIYASIPAISIDIETLDEAGILAALRSILISNGV